MIQFTVHIAPHERDEAIEAYRDRLTKEQVREIEDAPEDKWVKLTFTDRAVTVTSFQPMR